MQAKQHYLVLDAARGIAAISVVIYHLHAFTFPKLTLAVVPSLFARSFLAVDLFFLMSGLVVAEAYERKLLDGRMGFLQFVWTRALRLYPLYALGTALGFLYAIAKLRLMTTSSYTATPDVGVLIMNMSFLPGVSGRDASLFPFDPATWSLELEWIVNLAYAAWAVRQKTRTLAAMSAMAAICLIPLVIDSGSLDLGWGPSTLVGGIFRICFAFTLGVIFFRLRAAGWRTRANVHPLLLLALLTLVLATPFGVQTMVYDLICNFAVFPLFVALACESETPVWLRRASTELGRVSYAVYILHHPIMLWFGGAWKILTRRDLATTSAISAPLMLATIVAVSYASVVGFDEPIRRFLSGRLARRRGEPVPVGQAPSG